MAFVILANYAIPTKLVEAFRHIAWLSQRIYRTLAHPIALLCTKSQDFITYSNFFKES